MKFSLKFAARGITPQAIPEIFFVTARNYSLNEFFLLIEVFLRCKLPHEWNLASSKIILR